MKRRNFLGASGAALTGLSGCKSDKLESNITAISENSVLDENDLIGGKTLAELRDLYHYDLFDDYIPFHDEFVVDHEYGGFIVSIDRDGTMLASDKYARYQGRGLFTYGYLYNKLDNSPEILKILDNAVEFTVRHKPSGNNLWPEKFSRDGKLLQGPTIRVYEDLFIANGLSEYAKAVGSDKYWEMAKELLLKCLRIYDNPDYPPAGTDFFTGVEGISVAGPRIQGHWMCFMDQATGMLEYKYDSDVEEVAARSVDAVLNHHYNPEYRLNNEIINHDLSRVDDPLADYVDMGHCTETSWMAMYEAVRLKDRELFDLAAQRLKRHAEVAWDDVYGGLLHTLHNVDKNTWGMGKAQYLQAEMLVGALCVIEHTGAQWAKDLFTKLYTYVREKFPLRQYGFPLWIDYADRWVTFERHSGRAENFHHPRHLMLNLLSIDRMIKRGGQVSGLFK
ncbi:AGE family epimerase/isomerase [Candidatus Latescibacterota bacterium]